MPKLGRPLRVLCLVRDQVGHIRPVQEFFGTNAEFVYDDAWDPLTITPDRADIVLTVNDFHYGVAKCLDAARAAGIPTLIIQDGILEWRCQFENPLLGSGGGAPQHQPVLADKIACIGNQSVRQIGMWGNVNKVELTGMPRLDKLRETQPRSPRTPGSKLLVMTAKKPGFTHEQVSITRRSLEDVKKFAEDASGVEVVWRVTKGLEKELGVRNRLSEVGGSELREVLEEVDAVISTPSTAVIEAWLLGRPVAVLDYHNVPQYVPSAWSISAAEQIAPVVAELLEPPPRRLAYQEECLRDTLAVEHLASERVATLIQRLVDLSADSAGGDGTLNFPKNVLGVDPWLGDLVPTALELLYPDQEVYREKSTEALQARLARAAGEIGRLKQQLESRRFGYWLERLARWGAKAARKSIGR